MSEVKRFDAVVLSELQFQHNFGVEGRWCNECQEEGPCAVKLFLKSCAALQAEAAGLRSDLQMANERLGELTRERDQLRAALDVCHADLVRERTTASDLKTLGKQDFDTITALRAAKADLSDLVSQHKGCINALTRRLTALEGVVEALELVLPLAKGYAAEHPVGRNQEYVNEAVDALAALAPRRTGEGEEEEAKTHASQSLHQAREQPEP